MSAQKPSIYRAATGHSALRPIGAIIAVLAGIFALGWVGAGLGIDGDPISVWRLVGSAVTGGIGFLLWRNN